MADDSYCVRTCKLRDICMSSNMLDDLLQSLQRLFKQEYERGTTDILNRIVGTINGARSTRSKPRLKATRSRSKKRTPRGTARALILRVLSAKKAGARVPEIMAAAKTPAERTATVSAIRIELYTGKKKRRYVNKNGTWSLPIRK